MANNIKKKSNPNKPIYIFIIVVGILIIGVKFSSVLSRKVVDTKYDYVVVGNNCNCEAWSFDECKFTYGIKNGYKNTLKNNISANRSNMNNIVYYGNSVAYSDNKTGNEVYSSVREGECTGIGCEESEKQNNKEKEVFDKMVNIIGLKEMENYRYYIPTDKNYFIFNEYDGVIYKYDESNDTLDSFITLGTCDLDYFKEK